MAQDRKSIYDFFPRFEQIQLQEFYGSTKIFGFSPEVGDYIAFTVYANGEIFYKSQLDGGEGPGELINPAKCYHKEGYFSEIDGNQNFVKYSCKHCPETWEI